MVSLLEDIIINFYKFQVGKTKVSCEEKGVLQGLYLDDLTYSKQSKIKVSVHMYICSTCIEKDLVGSMPDLTMDMGCNGIKFDFTPST